MHVHFAARSWMPRVMAMAVMLTGASGWTVYHGGPDGAGVASVKSVDTARRSWTSAKLSGQIYGEPLVFGDRVYIATENNDVYALSAKTGLVDWRTHIGKPVAASSLPCGDITPVVGITGTPVIDQARHEIFVVADVTVNGAPSHRLIGLSTATGKQELSERVDPPGQDPAAILQRTALTLDAGRVVFGFGGNFGDCSTYRGRVIAVPERGGKPLMFTVDSGAGETQGAVWMGGAAPAVDKAGHLWISTGNGSVRSSHHAYDYSDGVLELSPTLRLVQFFAPKSWASDNANDLDFSTEPTLLPDGQVVLGGKSGRIYLLKAAHLGGIGGQQAALHSACGSDIDGGTATVGMTVYLPCFYGIIAVRAVRSPPALHVLWRSAHGGGPPIVAAGLVWTIGLNGTLYGLDPATGHVRRQVGIGKPANHFSTPGVGAGLLLAACADRVIAFSAHVAGAQAVQSPAASRSPGCDDIASGASGTPFSGRELAAIFVGAVAVIIGFAWLFRRYKIGHVSRGRRS